MLFNANARVSLCVCVHHTPMHSQLCLVCSQSMNEYEWPPRSGQGWLRTWTPQHPPQAMGHPRSAIHRRRAFAHCTSLRCKASKSRPGPMHLAAGPVPSWPRPPPPILEVPTVSWSWWLLLEAWSVEHGACSMEQGPVRYLEPCTSLYLSSLG